MTEYRFTWDPAKAAANFRKHGIAFADAAEVFLDPLRVTEQDRIEGSEYRWQTIGVVAPLMLVVVAHTDRDDVEAVFIRIISARKATPRERKRYVRKDG
jgi:uncharacterized protein